MVNIDFDSIREQFDIGNLQDYKVLVELMYQNYFNEEHEYKYKLYNVLEMLHDINSKTPIKEEAHASDLFNYLNNNDDGIISGLHLYTNPSSGGKEC